MTIVSYIFAVVSAFSFRLGGSEHADKDFEDLQRYVGREILMADSFSLCCSLNRLREVCASKEDAKSKKLE